MDHFMLPRWSMPSTLNLGKEYVFRLFCRSNQQRLAKKWPLLVNYPFSSFKRTGVVQFKITLLLEKKEEAEFLYSRSNTDSIYSLKRGLRETARPAVHNVPVFILTTELCF